MFCFVTSQRRSNRNKNDSSNNKKSGQKLANNKNNDDGVKDTNSTFQQYVRVLVNDEGVPQDENNNSRSLPSGHPSPLLISSEGDKLTLNKSNIRKNEIQQIKLMKKIRKIPNGGDDTVLSGTEPHTATTMLYNNHNIYSNTNVYSNNNNVMNSNENSSSDLRKQQQLQEHLDAAAYYHQLNNNQNQYPAHVHLNHNSNNNFNNEATRGVEGSPQPYHPPLQMGQYQQFQLQERSRMEKEKNARSLSTSVLSSCIKSSQVRAHVDPHGTLGLSTTCDKKLYRRVLGWLDEVVFSKTMSDTGTGFFAALAVIQQQQQQVQQRKLAAEAVADAPSSSASSTPTNLVAHHQSRNLKMVTTKPQQQLIDGNGHEDPSGNMSRSRSENYVYFSHNTSSQLNQLNTSPPRQQQQQHPTTATHHADNNDEISLSRGASPTLEKEKTRYTANVTTGTHNNNSNGRSVLDSRPSKTLPTSGAYVQRPLPSWDSQQQHTRQVTSASTYGTTTGRSHSYLATLGGTTGPSTSHQTPTGQLIGLGTTLSLTNTNTHLSTSKRHTPTMGVVSPGLDMHPSHSHVFSHTSTFYPSQQQQRQPSARLGGGGAVDQEDDPFFWSEDNHHHNHSQQQHHTHTHHAGSTQQHQLSQSQQHRFEPNSYQSVVNRGGGVALTASF